MALTGDLATLSRWNLFLDFELTLMVCLYAEKWRVSLNDPILVISPDSAVAGVFVKNSEDRVQGGCVHECQPCSSVYVICHYIMSLLQCIRWTHPATPLYLFTILVQNILL